MKCLRCDLESLSKPDLQRVCSICDYIYILCTNHYLSLISWKLTSHQASAICSPDSKSSVLSLYSFGHLLVLPCLSRHLLAHAAAAVNFISSTANNLGNVDLCNRTVAMLTMRRKHNSQVMLTTIGNFCLKNHLHFN